MATEKVGKFKLKLDSYLEVMKIEGLLAPYHKLSLNPQTHNVTPSDLPYTSPSTFSKQTHRRNRMGMYGTDGWPEGPKILPLLSM